MSGNKSTIVFQPKPTAHNFRDLEGQKFFRLTVIGFAGTANRRTFWFCRCECGTVKKISKDNLLNKSIKSCGCYNKESARLRPQTHGATVGGKPPEYRAYIQAKIRCNNPNRPQWKDYGGRGIEFRFNSFEDFLAEVGRKPTPKHSLGRKNNDGHYEKGNVGWESKITQSRNKRNNRLITVDGITKTVPEWAETNGLLKQTCHTRLNKGWCEQCAVTLPIGKGCSHKIS